MKVANWHGGLNFTLDTIADPIAKSGQVIVKVHTVGICGTEVHYTQQRSEVVPPLVLGHEFTGTIVEVGSGVDRKRLGENVVCEPSYGCGECFACNQGSESYCSVSQIRPGGFAEYAIMPSRTAHLLPAGLNLEEAAMTEPTACSLSGLEMFDMRPDSTILILGAGLLGVTSMMLGLRRGASKAIVSDPVAHRRDFAKLMGADIVVDPDHSDLDSIVDQYTNGLGVDVAFEAVGSGSLGDKAISLTRRRGRVQIVGVSPAGHKLSCDLVDMHKRQLTIGMSMSRGLAFKRALSLMPELGLGSAINFRYPLSRISDAFIAASKGESIRVVVGSND